MQIRTDLALEIRESFEKDDVEVRGVEIQERYKGSNRVKVTTVKIKNSAGAALMNKPMGNYITIEAPELQNKDEDYHSEVSEIIANELEKLVPEGAKQGDVLVLGLGNREATPDALGPWVVDNLFVTRHLIKECGEKMKSLSAIAPGVMGQTGMESSEILKGLVEQIKPALVVVIDALAARSTTRLNTTVQITDTGISPGAGIGNNRQEINKQSLGVDVIALGVPTVVDAGTIVRDRMEEALKKQGYKAEEIEAFLYHIEADRIENMFVTPKNVDEAVKSMSYTISEAINKCFSSTVFLQN